MAPDRGRSTSSPGLSNTSGPAGTVQSSQAATTDSSASTAPLAHDSPDGRLRDVRAAFAKKASEPQNFTFRGVAVGLVIGVIICFSNMYFGLQTGWVSSMSMPSALIGFAFFKTVSRSLSFPFTPVENVLVQSVAGSVGTMPLGCGFVGVLPALNFLLRPEENGPLDISLWKLIVWAVGICFFGVVFAVPLRKEVIIREKLKFPSGTASALMIGVLHGEKIHNDDERTRDSLPDDDHHQGEEGQSLISASHQHDDASVAEEGADTSTDESWKQDWKDRIRLLTISFGVSALYTLVSYFLPPVRDIPIFGLSLAQNWLWTLNPSPAYIGQGIIMGPATTTHMLIGAIIGWGILSPLAKSRGWAPGPISDWESGSKGWIVWISLAIMLADSLVSLGWLCIRPLIAYGGSVLPAIRSRLHEYTWKEIITFNFHKSSGDYAPLQEDAAAVSNPIAYLKHQIAHDDDPAPPEHQISPRTTIFGLVISLVLSVVAVHITFPGLIPFALTLFSLVLALLLSIMGVRALGETDLNPVSGISKITQLLFALVTPTSGPGAKNAIIINLVAGAVSESGALQAGDLLQDLKTGHLLNAAPNAQFWGQIIGSAVGAVVSACVYKLYTNVYTIPGGLFQVPTGYVWIFTARLVTGKGLPPMVGRWAAGAGAIWAVGTAARVYGNMQKAAGHRARWIDWIPGGIAVAVGMYNVPSFTLARAVGGLVNWYWKSYRKQSETPIVVLASGLILGEGVFSIVNLLLASVGTPHL